MAFASLVQVMPSELTKRIAGAPRCGMMTSGRYVTSLMRGGATLSES